MQDVRIKKPKPPKKGRKKKPQEDEEVETENKVLYYTACTAF